MRDLAGRRALLTGASSGLGPVIARRLRREGVGFVLSARGRPGLEALAAELGDARVVVADLTRPEDVERLAREAGPVDILIANAGLPANGRLLDLEVERRRPGAGRQPAGDDRADPPAAAGHGRARLAATSCWSPRWPAGSRPPARRSTTRPSSACAASATRSGPSCAASGVGVSLVSPTFVSGAGMSAETGLRARAGETSPAQVAEACLRAIREDRAELPVAPLVQRLVGRLNVWPSRP